MKLGISVVNNDSHKKYVAACEHYDIDYVLINFMGDNWMNEVISANIDGMLLYPLVNTQYNKDGFDERVYFLEKLLKIPTYPSFNELYIYENKTTMAFWLMANNIPHAETHLFFNKEEAKKFVDSAKYPLVFKTKIGSAGIGVKFIKNKRQAKRLIRKMFPLRKYYFVPMINTGFTRVLRSKRNPLKIAPLINDKQFGFVMFQEKIQDIKWEWRLIKIGDSYFGHQKLEYKGKHSGSSRVGWAKPPEVLLNLIKNICEIGEFNSMNVDVFETKDGKFYVNELQTIFGSYDNSQMYIDGKPGRYRYINNEWVFEEGYFNQNGSMNLRVEDFIRILKEAKK